MSQAPVLGIIGGSGMYEFPGLSDIEHLDVETPFGKPSSPIILGSLGGKRVAFLVRHGLGHFINPTEVNYRANIYALKALGIQRVLSISACGSLRDDYAPGHIVIPDQLVDFTRKRKATFFEDGLVAHVGVADPYCGEFSLQVLQAVGSAGAVAHMGGALVTIEGPRFSTRGESNLFRSWGMSIIGMTASPEAFLAREAEMCYCTMAHVTDYDVWHVSEEPVSVEMVIRTLLRNTQAAQQAVRILLENLPETPSCGCDHAMADAFITRTDIIPAETRARLGILINKYLPA